MTFFDFFDNSAEANLRLEVDEAAAEKFELKSESEETLERREKMMNNDVMNYLFEKPDSGKVQLFVQYQKDLKLVTSNIDI